MRVLVACETSGAVRNEFLLNGHDAWSCDLLPSEDKSMTHIVGDVKDVIWQEGPWDLIIMHPPCTALCVSGNRWYGRFMPKENEREQAVEWTKDMWYKATAVAPYVCMENPVGVLNRLWRKPTQIIQPYDFGHDASKKTCLWLEGLPTLEPTDYYPPRYVDGYPRWGNQTDSGQNKLGPSEDRWKERSRTYKGIAKAMADQWGRLNVPA
jgi:hypothetical protein